MTPPPASTGESVTAAGAVACGHTKFAIIGAGPGRRAFDWTDRTWCVQALNEIAQPYHDRHWELHPRRVQSTQDLLWLSQDAAPCYVLDPAEWAPGEIAQPVRYPLEWVLEQTQGPAYFTCTFAYQIAYAIAAGFTTIGAWGLELDYGTARERLVEKPCAEFWLGVALGRGLTVILPDKSPMLTRPFKYGYDYEAEVGDIKQVVREFEVSDWRAWSPAEQVDFFDRMKRRWDALDLAEGPPVTEGLCPACRESMDAP